MWRFSERTTAARVTYAYSPNETLFSLQRRHLGKASFSSPTLFSWTRLAIVIVRLNQIREEQAAKIRSVDEKPCLLTGVKMSESLLDSVASLRYPHLLTSPELVVGNNLRRVVAPILK